jgi:WD40 repeat protein/ABC-type branched-subunit amino acid transport system substrate-binding protein/DNA-binding SARP family transcriptional activator
MLEVRLLGQFALHLDGAIVVLHSRPAQSLLAYLALTAGTAHRREKLAGLLWPDSDEDNARNSLRHALWRIRRAIETDEVAAPYLLTDELAVSFNAGADYWLDAALLTHDGDSLQEQLDAVAVYRGDLLPGFYDDWVTLERDRLEAVFQHKMQRLLDRMVEERRWPHVLEWGERWVALGHAPEPGYRALMRAHAELGDRARVAAIYQRCREALFNDLGVEPSNQTRRLFEQLRRNEPELVAGPAATAASPTHQAEAPAAGESPYQGLHYFDEADADRFFGRERLTARLVGRLRAEPFVAVLGASGSGKSSVVRAGLVPALRRADPSTYGNGRSTNDLDVCILTPTTHPLDALAASLLPNLGGLGRERVSLLDELGRDPHGLRRFLQRDGLRQRVVLVIDQFEELFTLCHDSFEREAFAENVLAAVDSGGPARVVIALRADFYAHCAQYPGLRESVAQHQEYVGPLTSTELRRAIEGPLAPGGWELEAGLTDLLLRDIGEEPGALALLSHALLETWRRRRGRRLTLAGYAASGGVQGAIAQTAEMVYAEHLTPRQQAIARRLLLRLTELGEGTQDTRRRARLDELIRRPEEDAEVRVVLRLLADARLVTLGGETAEVAHEALIREWSKLREWLSQDRENLRIQRQLARAAQDWERLGRDAGGLYRGARLVQAVAWTSDHGDELGPLERGFVEASMGTAERETAERDAQRQRELEAAHQLAEAEQRRAEVERERADEQHRAASQLRQRAVLLGLAFAIAVLMAGAAAFFGNAAGQQATRAEADARAAISRALAAAALTNLTVDPERAGLLALQAVEATFAVDQSWTPEAEDALHRTALLLRTQLTLVGHAGSVSSVAFSADGAAVATAGQDRTAKVWNALTGEEQLTLHGHTGPVNAVAFGPDGGQVATASDDGTARIWDTATGHLRLTLVGHAREVERLAFSPDGRWLATTSLDGTVRLWDTASGATILAFQPARVADIAAAIDVAFSPDGGRLATAIPEGEIDQWELSSGRPRLLHTWQTSQYGGRFSGHAVAFSPDGMRVAATTDAGAQVWWAVTGEPALSIVGHNVQILHAAFSPDGTRFATASLEQTARIWDAQSGRELMSLTGHQAAINRVAFSPDSQRLATASRDGTARIWDLQPAHEVLTILNRGTGGTNRWLRQEGPQAGQVAISSEGTRLMAGLEEGTTQVWDTRAGQQVLALRGHQGKVWGAAISGDGSRLATGGSDQTVRVWDARKGDIRWTGSAHTETVVAVAFSPDGTTLASASADKTARIWDSATGQALLALAGHTDALTSLAFSPDGVRVATASEGSEDPIRIWDVRSGSLLRTLAGHQDVVWSVAFSPDGARLVSASRDGTARIWDAASGASILTLPGHGTLVSAIFSPDGRRVATGNRDGISQLWDAATGQELQELTGTEVGEGVDSVAFSADGRYLVVRGDEALRLYALPIEDLTALVRSRLTRWLTLDECRRFLHLEQCPPSRLEATRQHSGPPVAGQAVVGPSDPSTDLQSAPGPRRPVTELPVATAPVLATTSNLSGTIKIVSSLPRLGGGKRLTDSIVNAFTMALNDHNNRVGDATITYVDMDDSAFASTGSADAPTETANANKAANDPDVMVYLGPLASGAARQAIPILCQANLALISPTNTYPGLTRQTPYNASGEPDAFYPNCKRNYTRVVATDDVQGAVGAEFAKRIGATRVYALHNSEAYGEALAAAFADTARDLGLQVVGGPEGMDPAAANYRTLAQKVRGSGADLVYWGGATDSGAGRLWQDLRAVLGPTVKLMGPDGINEPAFVRAAGSAAEGTYATFPGVPASQLTGKGANWYRRYKQQYHDEPDLVAAYGYEAMNVALAAIERAGKKDRAAIREAVFATQHYDGVLGTWSFTPTGDTTLARMSVRQVRNGKWDDSTVQIIEPAP